MNVIKGDHVVFNKCPDAAVWKVLEVERFSMTITDAVLANKNINSQTYVSDVSLCFKPTKLQLINAGID